jgi:small subunit ribosomal protein S17
MTMADEEKTETTEETPETEAPETSPEVTGGDSESPTPESQPAPPGSEGEEAAADGEAVNTDAEAEESAADAVDQDAPSEDAAAEAPPPAAAEDSDDGLNWKTRKRLATSRESGEAGPQRSAEERATARAEARASAGKSRAAYRAKQRAAREKGEGTAPVEHESASRKERRGYVVSDKADKTITVRIDVARRHPAYEKIVRTSSTLHAHDEANEAGEGDLVKIVETRPLSKTKRWRLVEVMEKAK